MIDLTQAGLAVGILATAVGTLTPAASHIVWTGQRRQHPHAGMGVEVCRIGISRIELRADDDLLRWAQRWAAAIPRGTA